MANEHDKAVLDSIFNPLLPVGEYIQEEDFPVTLQDDEDNITNIEEVKQLELEGVRAAERDVDTAIAIFTRVINIAPNWASGYNNRAQAYRLKGNLTDAIEDLNRAVTLSGGLGRSGCQALCQRGIVHRKEGHDDLAKKDFEAAAKLGSQFAKLQLVDMNPYAALCNQMLHEVMTKLQQA